MDSLLPIISITELQRSPKKALDSLKDYAVIQSHGRDRGLVLHPRLGRLLVESGMLEQLLEIHNARGVKQRRAGSTRQAAVPATASAPAVEPPDDRLDGLIGNVLFELSKK